MTEEEQIQDFLALERYVLEHPDEFPVTRLFDPPGENWRKRKKRMRKSFHTQVWPAEISDIPSGLSSPVEWKAESPRG